MHFVGWAAATRASFSPTISYADVPCDVTLQVLYLTEPIDEVAIHNLAEYGDMKFVDVSREGIDLGTDDQDTKTVGKALLPSRSLLPCQATLCLSATLCHHLHGKTYQPET